MAFLRRH